MTPTPAVRVARWLEVVQRTMAGEAVDWPGAYVWRELVAALPEAKVILTVRDPEPHSCLPGDVHWGECRMCAGRVARYTDFAPGSPLRRSIMTEEERLAQHIETIARWISQSKHIIAFTGAGISTDSGIPDFRGPSGVWTRRDAGLPPPKWQVSPNQVKPNASHLALVELQQLGKLQFLITQNTDNLHRQSGICPTLLAELHGNGQLLRCLGCDRLDT